MCLNIQCDRNFRRGPGNQTGPEYCIGWTDPASVDIEKQAREGGSVYIYIISSIPVHERKRPTLPTVSTAWGSKWKICAATI